MVEDLRLSGLSTVSKLARRAANVSISVLMVAMVQKGLSVPESASETGLWSLLLANLSMLIAECYGVFTSVVMQTRAHVIILVSLRATSDPQVFGASLNQFNVSPPINFYKVHFMVGDAGFI